MSAEIKGKQRKVKQLELPRTYPKTRKPGYHITTIGLDEDDLDKLADVINWLQAKGYKRVNKSSVMRLALQMLDPTECTKVDVAISLMVKR
jgi:hypothetical protein